MYLGHSHHLTSKIWTHYKSINRFCAALHKMPKAFKIRSLKPKTEQQILINSFLLRKSPSPLPSSIPSPLSLIHSAHFFGRNLILSLHFTTVSSKFRGASEYRSLEEALQFSHYITRWSDWNVRKVMDGTLERSAAERNSMSAAYMRLTSPSFSRWRRL